MRTRLAFLLPILAGQFAAAQQPPPTPPPQLDLDSIVKAHSYQLRNSSGKINDEGWAFMMHEIGDAQIVAIAEEHNVQEIPHFLTMLFARLHNELGFNYLADEQDPYALRLISSLARRVSEDSIKSLARRWPTALTFATDEEIDMLYKVARLSTGRGNALWGVDQAFGANHYLARLRELSPSAAATAKIDSLARVAEAADRQRYDSTWTHFMARIATEDDFARLRVLFKPAAGSEADWLITALERSAHIYTAYTLAANQNKPTGWENTWSRERYMKERFSEEYHIATSRGDSLPRVLVKAGHWHIHRGLFPQSLALTFGTFVSELAQFNGRQSYVISTGITGPPGQWRQYSNPIARSVPPNDWTLVDLRALRPYARGRRIRDMTGELQQLIFGADAVLYFGGAHPGTESLKDSLARPTQAN
ncbi:MAG TPA: hypothetical protein VJ852_10160 [Gemmatimonadaceae bacterium]|nr:hypothetical protein [Gemmatimonadaceae bacterium]